MMSAPDIYYFGAHGYHGHQLWRPQDGRVERLYSIDRPPDLPWHENQLDGPFCPSVTDMRRIDEVPQPEGLAALHHESGWTMLAFWDRSGDRRRNSNSAFLARGILTFEEIVELAREQFPTLWERFGFEVRLAGGEDLARGGR